MYWSSIIVRRKPLYFWVRQHHANNQYEYRWVCNTVCVLVVMHRGKSNCATLKERERLPSTQILRKLSYRTFFFLKTAKNLKKKQENLTKTGIERSIRSVNKRQYFPCDISWPSRLL